MWAKIINDTWFGLKCSNLAFSSFSHSVHAVLFSENSAYVYIKYYIVTVIAKNYDTKFKFLFN